jgi:serine protease inhibitor
VTPFSSAGLGADAVNRLGFRLLDELRAEPSRNVLLSPCSLAFCLAIAVNGATGRTRAELAGALDAEALADEEVNRRFRDLRVLVEEPGGGLDVDLANAVWGPPGAAFDPDFVRRVQQFYAAEARILDQAGSASADTVNRWVSDRTKGRITTLVGAGDLAGGLGCVLTNAVYFKGPWAAPFEPGRTRPGPFTLPDGRRTIIDMMTLSGRHSYLATDDFQAVALDYADGNVSAYVVLPDPGVTLDLSRWDEWLPNFQSAQVALTLPRFSVASELDLVQPLSELGIRAAFGPGADFSRMGLTGAVISALRHAARLDVSEEGTEAAASTAVVMTRSLPRVASMVVDRPFFLAVVDRRSGLLLFLGRISEPEPVPGGTAGGVAG